VVICEHIDVLQKENMLQTQNHTDILWYTAKKWEQVYLSIKKIDDLHREKLGIVYKTANQIRQKFKEMSGLIEEICSQTCVYCKDICCIRATIWFDLKDLIYIYFGTQKFPEHQIIKSPYRNHKKACCHFTKKGCMLPRVERPFVCTWYFCPDQKQYIIPENPNMMQCFNQNLEEIKNLRNKMENEFIRVSCLNSSLELN